MPDDISSRLGRLTPEIQAMMGVYALYWKLEESFDCIETDLSHQECHMLIKLDQPKRMGILAADMLTVPSTITATADALEEAGYLARQRDPEDRRAWLLVLTEQGEEARNMLVTVAGELFQTASGLNAEETAEFARLARKIRDNILKTGIPEGLKK
ncbi:MULTISPECIES: MarR family winged helix-turn-helix transcriptional regulator [Alphaproteobacteria]|uniref:MarR family winged helix-turn-helix transcriptional regulator n=1 Tax=Alphaproteobacteria TaxID=28211 RepID=UPI0012BCF558|nr:MULTISPECIES: MarR family transcriptional regulator [Alphaproteobacteria]MTI00797.1 MarR family transcriptional regulator [Roseibium sp. RKSG952]